MGCCPEMDSIPTSLDYVLIELPRYQRPLFFANNNPVLLLGLVPAHHMNGKSFFYHL